MSVGTSLLSLTPADLSAVREVGAIGAGHAATALARLTGIRVELAAPELKVHPLLNMPPIFSSFEEPATGVLLPYGGDMEGHFLLLLQDEGAALLLAALFPEGKDPGAEMRDSALAETGSILGGAFLTILSRITGHLLIPTPPVLVRDMMGAILDEVLAEVGAETDHALVIRADLRDPAGGLLAHAVLVPDPAGLALFLEAAARLRTHR